MRTDHNLLEYNAKMKIITFIFIALFSTSLFAENPSWSADTQSFGVSLFLVPDSDAFVEMWSKPETPNLSILHEIQIETEFAAVILYWGGGKDLDGNCNIHVKTTVLVRDEIIVADSLVPVCKQHAPPNPGILALGDTIIDLKATGAPANLVVQIEVSDNVNNEVLWFQHQLRLLTDEKHT